MDDLTNTTNNIIEANDIDITEDAVTATLDTTNNVIKANNIDITEDTVTATLDTTNNIIDSNKNEDIDKDSALTNTEKKHIVVMPHNNKKLNIDKDYKFAPKSKLGRAFVEFLGMTVVSILHIYNKLFLGLKVVGKENYKSVKNNGLITVSNHFHFLDAPLVASCLYPSFVNFTSIEDNFTIPVIGKFIKAVGVIPIPKDIARLRYFVSYVDKAIKEGNRLHFFPEGVLLPYNNVLNEFGNGAFLQAEKANCPILPIVFCQRKATGIFKFLKPHRCCFTAYILEAQYIDTSLNKKQRIAELKDRVYNLMNDTLQKHSENVVEIDYSKNL